MKEHKYMI